MKKYYPSGRLLFAGCLAALNYAALTGYDFLAFRYIGNRLGYARIALASFIAYAYSNNIGLTALSGSSIRYRFYTAWLFNKSTGLAIVCPITNTECGFPFHIPMPKDSKLAGFIMVEQVKSVDFRAHWSKVH